MPRYIARSFIVLICCWVVALADGGGADVRFTGKVIDQNASGIPGAHIVALLVGTGIRTESEAAADGSFHLELVKGEYTITVTSTGFERLSRRVAIGQNLSVEETFTLSVAAASAEVTVSDDTI